MTARCLRSDAALFSARARSVPRPRGLEVEGVAHDARAWSHALPGRHEPLDAVGEEHRADPVVVRHRREGEQRGELGREVALGQVARAEVLGARDVDEQEDRQVALLDELLDVRDADAGRDVPVDGADVVAGRVLAHLGELHAAALEDRVVLAPEPRVDEAVGPDLDAVDLLERSRGGAWGCAGPQGTSTRSRIRATTWSLVTFSASAS